MAFELAFWIHAKGTSHSKYAAMMKAMRAYGYLWGDGPLSQWIVEHCTCNSNSTQTSSRVRILPRSTMDPEFFHLDLTFANSETILFLINRFDRVLYGRDLSDKTAKSCANALTEICEEYSIVISKLLTDRGGEWQAEFKDLLDSVEKYMNEQGKHFTHLTTLACSPHMNGLVESVNRRKKPLQLWMMQNQSYSKEELEAEVAKTVSVYNNTPHSILGMSPIEFKSSTITEFKKLQSELLNAKSIEENDTQEKKK